MIELVERQVEKLNELCAEHKVKELYLFGSAATDEFDEKSSDLDFVVEFTDAIDTIDFADYYFSFLDGLKTLFEGDVDLLSYTSLKNDVIIQQIEDTKVQLYAT